MLLHTAAILLVLVGIAHSYLGERYILIRLFRRTELPQLLGSDWFTRRTLRFAWHLTTILFWGLAAILVLAALTEGAELRRGVLLVFAGTFFVSAMLSGVASRGRHLSWVVFLVIAGLAWLAHGAA